MSANLNTKNKLQKLFQLTAGVSAFAWIVALYTLWHRQGLLAEGAMKPSFCNMSSFLNCDAVALSAHSEFLGIPVSTHAMIFSFLLFLLSLVGFFNVLEDKSKMPSWAAKLLFALSAIGLIPTVYQAYVSIFVIQALCLMCLTSYILNLVLFALSWKLKVETKSLPTESTLSGFKTFSQVSWIVVAVVIALHFITPAVMMSSLGGAAAGRVDSKYIELVIQKTDGMTPMRFTDDGKSPSFGAAPDQAKLTVVEFSDFQCPFCAKSAALLPSLLKQYENRVRFVYKNYPLDASCNSEMKHSAHPLGCKAAKAGVCVHQAKGNAAFFDYKKEVFANQKEMTAESILVSAEKHSGTSRADLEKCIEDPAVAQKINADVAEGSVAKVQGTPAIFLNGKFFESGPQPVLLQAILEHYLK